MGRLPASIVIDLDPDADPIAGRVSTDGESPRGFTGWTGLFGVLRAATGADGRGESATEADRTSAGRASGECQDS